MSIVKLPGYAWIAWLLPAVAFMVMYIARVAPAVIVPQMVIEFHADTAQIGALGAAFMMSYIIMQIPVGILADRFGPVRLLIVASIIAIIGNCLFGSATSLMQAFAARFILGIGSACIFICALQQARLWLEPHFFVMACGLTQVFGMLGAALGNSAVGMLCEQNSWRHVVHSITLLWIGLLILMMIFLRNKKSEHAHDASVSLKDLLQGFAQVVKNRNAWLNGLYAGLVFLPMQVLGEWWGPYYLSMIHNISIVEAGSLISAMFIGWAIAGSFIGYIAGKYKLYKELMISSSLLTLLTLCLGLYLRGLQLEYLKVIFFMLGFSSTGLVNAYAIAPDLSEAKVSGSAMAFANVMSILIGASLQPIIGVLVSYYKNYYSEVVAFDKVILILPVSLLLATFCAYLLQLPSQYNRQSV